MQVAAYTSGKDSVSLTDCLLLQHILWQEPEQQSRITDFLLAQISEDDGLQSASYILASQSLHYLLVYIIVYSQLICCLASCLLTELLACLLAGWLACLLACLLTTYLLTFVLIF